MRKAFLRQVRRFPWVTNVTLYGCLFAGGDFVHQWFSRREQMDWSHTRNVALIAFSFHGNFNFFWMRFLERRFPGNSAGMVMRKLLLDQTTAAPLATSVFYTGRWVVGQEGETAERCTDCEAVGQLMVNLKTWHTCQFVTWPLSTFLL